MTVISCANTEGDAHVAATAAFDEAASSLGELGFVYEVTRDARGYLLTFRTGTGRGEV